MGCDGPWTRTCSRGISIAVRVDLELLDQAPELCGGFHQLLRRLLGIGRSTRGALRSLGHSRNVARNLTAAMGRFAHVARHLVGGRVLLLHGCGDRCKSVSALMVGMRTAMVRSCISFIALAFT